MTDWKRLQAPMPPEAVEWRVQTGGEKNGRIWALVVPYADSRWLMSRLDEVLGPENWRDEYVTGPGGKGSILCHLSIRCGDEWVTKSDVGDESNIHAEKGAVTDAFKRACVKWNVGNIRALYQASEGFAKVHPGGRLEGMTPKKAGSKRFKYDPPHIDLAAKPAAVQARVVEETEQAPQRELAQPERLEYLRAQLEDRGLTGRRASEYVDGILGRRVTRTNGLSDNDVDLVLNGLKSIKPIAEEAA